MDGHGWRAMTGAPMTLLEQLEAYILARDISRGYADLLRTRVRKFQESVGSLPIADVNCEIVNRFLMALQTIGTKPQTVDGYRRAIMCVWSEAYQLRLNDNPPLRVRKIRKPYQPVEGFTIADIQSLLAHTETLKGYLPNGVRRSDFWQCAIHSAYGTALRRGDLLSVKKNQIRLDGVAQVVQHKTGFPVWVQFPPEALAAMKRMPVEIEEACPWPHHENALSRQFRALLKAAGVRDGQFRWLRRSGPSYADAIRPGDGSKMLGHRDERVFHRHYEITAITRSAPVSPPPLAG
jgi:integrase